MNHFTKSFFFLTLFTGFPCVSYAQQFPAGQQEYSQRFMSDFEKYRACLIAYAIKEVGVGTKTPAAIADEAHGACKTAFSAALRSSIVFNESIDSQHRRRRAVDTARNIMAIHKAEMRNHVIDLVKEKRYRINI